MKSMLRSGLLAGVIVGSLSLCAGFGTGCATAVPEIEARLTADNRAVVDGDSVPLARLPDRLRSAGARSGTLIKIQFEPGGGQPPFGEVARTLKAAGYPKFFFVGPRQARSGVAPAEPPAR